MKTQALGWLATAVVAAGLNASYHQGGMQWAHEIVGQVSYRTSAVVALATGHAERFAEEVRLARLQDQDQNQDQAQVRVSSCRFQNALARVRTRIAHSQERVEHFSDQFDSKTSARADEQQARMEEQTARMEAQRDRLEAANVRIEDHIKDQIEAQIETQIASKIDTNKIETKMARIRVPAVAMSPVVAPMPKLDICPRIRVNLPRITGIAMPAIHVPAVDVPAVRIPAIRIPAFSVPSVPALDFDVPGTGTI